MRSVLNDSCVILLMPHDERQVETVDNFRSSSSKLRKFFGCGFHLVIVNVLAEQKNMHVAYRPTPPE